MKNKFLISVLLLTFSMAFMLLVKADPGISVTITDVKSYITTPSDVAIFVVNVESVTTEDENVKLTISGDPQLAFNWTTNEFILAVGDSASFGLEITYSGSTPGDFEFTVLGEAWPLGFTYEEAQAMGLMETSSSTDYVNVPPTFIIPIAPAGVITLGLLMTVALALYIKLPRRK